MTVLQRLTSPKSLVARAKLAIRNREGLIYDAAWEDGQTAANVIGTRYLLQRVCEYLTENVDHYAHLEVVDKRSEGFVVRRKKDA